MVGAGDGSRVRAAMVAVAVIGLASLSQAVGAESFRATVLPAGDPPRRTWEGLSAENPLQISVRVDSWSTAEEIRGIKAALDEDGEDAAAWLVRSARAGTIVPPPHVGFGEGTVGVGREPTWRIVLAHARHTAVARELLLITDRPLDIYDTSTVEQRPTKDVGFGAMVLELDRKGCGKGRILPRARVQFFEDGTMTLAAPPPHIASFPVIEVVALAK